MSMSDKPATKDQSDHSMANGFGAFAAAFYEDSKNGANYLAKVVRKQARRSANRLRARAEHHPTSTVLMAAGAGFLTAMLLMRRG
jgi:ElaB/YqjD/DUF883 family membrane-anchored ribosome-binding protein